MFIPLGLGIIDVHRASDFNSSEGTAYSTA